MARVLIVGGDDRAGELAAALLEDGHAVRVVLGGETGLDAGLPAGAERFDGDPDRPGTLKAALEQVTVACWLFGDATGAHERVAALHGARLERFLHQTIDSPVRGLVYEAAGSVDAGLLAAGRALVNEFADRNAIPLALITADPAERGEWLTEARTGVAAIIGRYSRVIP